MMDLDQRMNRFRVASRELFNTYFRREGASGSTDVDFQHEAWLLEERYSDVESILFEKLVLEPSALVGRYGEHNPKIRVALTSDFAPIMVNREKDSGYWDYPVNEVLRSVRMEFVHFFDWDQLALRDHRYVRVFLADWPGHPDLVGKHALLETIYASYVEG